jgi:hypothetical protein
MAAIAATAISAGLAGLAVGPAHAAGATAPGPAASSRPASGPAATNYSTPGGLAGVAAASASDAWAVGGTGPKVLMLHWNGAKWSRVASPKVLTGTGALDAITVVSAKDAWAVGYTGTNASDHTLLLHWNGKTWSQVTSPKPVGGTLRAVSATASGGWAVGDAHPGGAAFYPLILRLTSTTWSRPKTAYGTHADDDVILDGVAVTPGSTAWAAGTTQETSGLARWNGKTWTSEYALFPLPGQYFFTGIATGPAGTGFVVGSESHFPASPTPFSGRLTGTTWKKVTVSAPSNAQLNAVTFAPGGTAWGAGAVGTRALIVRWTGSEWARITSPSPGSRSAMAGLAFSASNYGWAAGTSGPDTLILHWNGKTWS